jgi:aspartate ammonia-lyase
MQSNHINNRSSNLSTNDCSPVDMVLKIFKQIEQRTTTIKKRDMKFSKKKEGFE